MCLRMAAMTPRKTLAATAVGPAQAEKRHRDSRKGKREVLGVGA